MKQILFPPETGQALYQLQLVQPLKGNTLFPQEAF